MINARQIITLRQVANGVASGRDVLAIEIALVLQRLLEGHGIVCHLMDLPLGDHAAYTIMRGTKPSSAGDDPGDVAELLATVVAFNAGALICGPDDQIPVANFQDALPELHRIVAWCPRDAYAARRRWMREYFRIACKAIREALRRE